MEVKNEAAYVRRLVSRVAPTNSEYSKLFSQMNETDFIILIQKDANRAMDGLNLRSRIGGDNLYLDKDCSVLEMMVALACRIEDNIMLNYSYGDRAGQWFWEMLVNMGLGGMTDDMYDSEYVSRVLTRFNYRQYNYDGSGGGIFVIPDPPNDLSKTEIWYQASWYLSRLFKTGRS